MFGMGTGVSLRGIITRFFSVHSAQGTVHSEKTLLFFQNYIIKYIKIYSLEASSTRKRGVNEGEILRYSSEMNDDADEVIRSL